MGTNETNVKSWLEGRGDTGHEFLNRVIKSFIPNDVTKKITEYVTINLMVSVDGRLLAGGGEDRI